MFVYAGGYGYLSYHGYIDGGQSVSVALNTISLCGDTLVPSGKKCFYQ